MGIEEITVSLLACREGTHTKTMKFLKDDKHCPYLFDRRYGLYYRIQTRALEAKRSHGFYHEEAQSQQSIG